VENLSNRSARDVLDDHLNLANEWGAEEDIGRILEEDMRRNVSEDCVILMNRGVFRGFPGIRQLAYLLAEELPEHRSFQYTHTAVDGRMGFLEWAYEDATVRVRTGSTHTLSKTVRLSLRRSITPSSRSSVQTHIEALTPAPR
jgi:hypothetical protein